MLRLQFGGAEFRKRLSARAGVLRRRYIDAFFRVVGHVKRHSQMSAPVGRWFKGGLRRSAYVDESGSTPDIVRAEIGFTVPYARLVHENYAGVTIRPTKRYLYIPLTRKGYKAGQTHDYSGLKSAKKNKAGKWKGGDYLLTPKPVHLRPQKHAGFLIQHAKRFWQLFYKVLGETR